MRRNILNTILIFTTPALLGAAEVQLTIDPAENPQAAVQELISAITTANETPEPDVIKLYPDAVYNFPSPVSENTFGKIALPVIEGNGPNEVNNLTLVGNKSVFQRDENAEHFRFIFVGEWGRLSVQNIKFKNGNSNDTEVEWIEKGGGAIRSHGHLTIDDCIFTGNQAGSIGGAFYQTGNNARVIISNTKFSDNFAESYGGAIDSTGAIMHINNCSFENNSTLNEGGALAFAEGEVVIENSHFAKNKSYKGGAIRTWGLTDISNSTFDQNQSTERGGAILLRGKSIVKLTDSTFTDNSSDTACGGAIDLHGGIANIESCQFEANTAGTDGGAISSGGILTIENSKFVSNSAGLGGGALNTVNMARVENCEFIDNKANTSGGAILNQILQSYHGSSGVFRNNVISGNVCDTDQDGTGDGGAVAHIAHGKIVFSSNTIHQNIDEGNEANDVFGFIASYEENYLTSIEGSTGLENDFVP